ncbi:MAG: cohesin domain-containing protein, partial [bacterium]|nr:cohesin domain-containing protein [bacterium]
MANWLRRCFGFGVLAAVFFWGGVVQAASLSIGPAAGTVTVDSTFDVSLFVNTEGDTVNALEVSVSFPSDKLQLVSPTAGKSVIELWTAPPRFNNQAGRIELQGGIPGGLKVSQGLVIKLTFRAKSVGTAVVKFLDNSKILKHDGRGTDVLGNTSNGIYQIELPPPAGPVVVSPTHPDQGAYYVTNDVLLQWSTDG